MTSPSTVQTDNITNLAGTGSPAIPFGIKGRTDSGTPVLGELGFVSVSNPGGTISTAASGSYKTFAMVTLPKGVWLCSGTVWYSNTASMTRVIAAVSLTTNAVDTLAANNGQALPTGTQVTEQSVDTGPGRVVASDGTVTVYLVARFDGDTTTVDGTNTSLSVTEIA